MDRHGWIVVQLYASSQRSRVEWKRGEQLFLRPLRRFKSIFIFHFQSTVFLRDCSRANHQTSSWPPRARLTCVNDKMQLLAVLKEAAPGTLAGLPSWTTKGEEEMEEEEEEHQDGEERSPESSEEDGLSGADAGLGAPGSLARELRRKVFALEQTVFSLEGKLRLADEARLERGGAGGEEDGAASAIVAAYDGGDEQASSGGKGKEAPLGAGSTPVAGTAAVVSCCCCFFFFSHFRLRFSRVSTVGEAERRAALYDAVLGISSVLFSSNGERAELLVS